MIPSWRFFDSIKPSPRIEVAFAETPQEMLGGWREFDPRPKALPVASMLARLFWNPRWNESLFLVSCAERILEAPTMHSVRQIAGRIDAAGCAPAYRQFRLVLLARDGTRVNRQAVYVSPVWRAGESGSL